MASGWNVTRTALRPLNRAGLLAFGMRCAMRVDDLVLPRVKSAFEAAMDEETAAREAPSPTAVSVARTLSDLGSLASHDATKAGRRESGCVADDA